MKYIYLIVIICLTINAFGQDFIKLQNVDSAWSESISSIIKLDGNHVMLTSSGVSNGPGTPWHLINRKIASDSLQEIWKKIYYYNSDFSIFPLNVNFNSNDNLILSGSTSHYKKSSLNLDEGNDFICEMTPSGDVLWSKSIGEQPIKNWAVDITQVDDGNYATAGWKLRSDHPTVSEVTLRKISSTGDSLWTKIFRDTSNFPRSYKGRVALAGDSNSIFLLYQKQSPKYFSIAKFNGTTGTMTWEKEFKKGTATFVYNALMNSNGNMVLSTGMRFTDYCEPAIWEIDQNGNVVEYKGYFNEIGCALGGNIERMNDGGYGFLQYGFSHPHFVKVAANYDFEFQKSYPFENYMSSTGVVQMDDGSYILAGYEGATEKYTIWMIKTDSLGEFVSTLRTEVISESITVFPNPSSDYFQFNLGDRHMEDIKISLFGLDGQLILNKSKTNKIDVSSLPDGLYVLLIYDGGKLAGIEKVVKQTDK